MLLHVAHISQGEVDCLHALQDRVIVSACVRVYSWAARRSEHVKKC